MRFGIELGSHSVSEMIRLSRKAEQKGFSSVWIADHVPAKSWRDPFVSMAAIGQNTSDIHIGCGVVNPYSRHVGLTGIAIATLAELCGERVILGIGAGGTLPLKPLDIEMWNKPVTAIRESIEVLRKLFSKDLVDFDGRIVTLRNTELFDEFDVPIYLGTRGPMLSELAGRMADGIILNPPLDSLPYYLQHVEKGVDESKRDMIQVVEFLPMDVSESGDCSRLKSTVAILVPTTPRKALENMGVADQADKISEVMAQDKERAAELVNHDLISSFSICGTRNECVERIESLESEVDEITALSFGTVEGTIGLIERLGEEIIPSF